jgi:hypothetical protein
MRLLKKENLEIFLLLVLLAYPLSFAYTFLVHEPSHYLACVIQGHAASIKLNPMLMGGSVNCVDGDSLSPQGEILFAMAPYIVAILLLVFLSGFQNRLSRLTAYVAFFNTQENLTLPVINNFLFGLKVLDPFGMLKQISRVHPGYESAALLTAYVLIVLSILVLYVRYRNDFTTAKDKTFYRRAFIISMFYFLIGELALILFVIPQAQELKII